MYTVIVTLDVHEDRLDEFRDAIRVNREASLRDEPGCLRFDIHRSADHPFRFHLYEIYVDRKAFEMAHRAAPHYARWQEAAARCVVPGTHANLFASPLFEDQIPEGKR